MNSNTQYPISAIPFTQVSINDKFWAPRIETNRKVTVSYDFQKCEETGRNSNFAKAAGLMAGAHEGIFFNEFGSSGQSYDIPEALAGGTNLVDLMKDDVERPKTLIDISRLPLDKVEKTAGGEHKSDDWFHRWGRNSCPKLHYPGRLC